MTPEEYVDLVDKLIAASDELILFSRKDGQEILALYADRDDVFDFSVSLTGVLRKKQFNSNGLVNSLELLRKTRADRERYGFAEACDREIRARKKRKDKNDG